MDIQLIKNTMNEAYQEYHDLDDGNNASYIPYLANIDSKLCGMSVITTDGQLISVGDDEYRFALESISKVCTMALAMEEVGPSRIRTQVGDSSTGMPFNSVMALELHKDQPLSPLVNAGAIATTSIIQAKDKEDRWQKILTMQKNLMSSRVALSDELNESEQDTNFHNRAIAWLLYSAHHIYNDPMEAVEVYTRQCSTLVFTTDLATMASILANDGVNPITHETVLKHDDIHHILAEMTMEGLYNGSGNFAYEVGLPGKSGVGGGLMAVVPGKMGIATFSPKLDSAGNSIRGQAMIKYFANKLGLNIYDA